MEEAMAGTTLYLTARERGYLLIGLRAEKRIAWQLSRRNLPDGDPIPEEMREEYKKLHEVIVGLLRKLKQRGRAQKKEK
ncbi:unnamed protein product [marine sediment metagenome]|uniref:Uncharacterized protein n=1 Tax=marine sediment metagenome TaxID=412755 RepID=X0VX87_9ZZZZ